MSRLPDPDELPELAELVDCLQCIHGIETTLMQRDGREAVVLILRSDRPKLLDGVHDLVVTWAQRWDRWCGWTTPKERERRYELGDDEG